MAESRIAALTAMTLLVFILASCARGEIPASKWRGMTRNEKMLVVDSLRGHEAALGAKGGRPSSYPATNEAHVTRIDATYAGGDGRTVTAIWKSLARQRSGG